MNEASFMALKLPSWLKFGRGKTANGSAPEAAPLPPANPAPAPVAVPAPPVPPTSRAPASKAAAKKPTAKTAAKKTTKGKK